MNGDPRRAPLIRQALQGARLAVQDDRQHREHQDPDGGRRRELMMKDSIEQQLIDLSNEKDTDPFVKACLRRMAVQKMVEDSIKKTRDHP